MSVRQRPERGNAWYYRFTRDGVLYKGACKMPDGSRPRDRFDAMQCEANVLKNIEAGEIKAAPVANRKASQVTLEEAFAWHITKIEHEAGASHLFSFARYAREAINFFGEGRTLASLNQTDVDAFRRSVIARPRRVFIGGPNVRADHDDESLWRILDRRRSPSEVNHVLNAFRCALGAAHKVRDPVTNESILPFPPEVERVQIPKRQPTPMTDAEMLARREVAPPWVVDAIDLARLFGLRVDEALTLDVGNLDYPETALKLRPEQTKTGDEQMCYGGPEGWDLVKRLARQARTRGVRHLVTWPGTTVAQRLKAGHDPKTIPADAYNWRPLKSIRNAWRRTAETAGIAAPRRFHDLRAAYISEVAANEKSADDQGKKMTRRRGTPRDRFTIRAT